MKRDVVNGTLLALAYTAAAVLGLQWAEVNGAGSPVWPAFGIAVAGLVLGGVRLWPAIFIGRLAAGLLAGSEQPLVAEISIAAGNAFADAVGAWILTRYARLNPALGSLRDVLWLVGAALGSAALSATLGTATLTLSSGLAPAASGQVWFGWWFGNVVASVTVVPLILTWSKSDAFLRTPRQWLHLAACLSTTALLGYGVFLHSNTEWLRTWHMFPVLIWAALAFNVRGASAALLITSIAALMGASLGLGALTALAEDLPSRVRMAQQFIAVSGLTTLILAAIAQERRRIEEAARLAAVVSSTPDAIVSFSPEGEIQSWNKGAERLFGYSAQEALGRHGSMLLPSAPPDTPGSAFARAMAEGQVQLETVRVRKDGAPLHVAISASQMLGPAKEVLGVAAVIRDVSQRKRDEEALREESGTLEILNRTGAALAAELDLERLVQRVTDAGVELTGAQFGAFFYNVLDDKGESLMLYTLSGAERSAFERFGHPRATAVFEPTFKGERVVRSGDITAEPVFGKNPPFNGLPKGHLPVRSYLAVPVISRSGQVIGGLFFGHEDRDVFSERSERVMVGLASQAAIAIDNARLFQAVQRANQTLEERVKERTSELEHAHEALRQAQKMEAIGQLTGGIAHDFNNLLTVIRGSTDLLRRPDLPEEKRRRYIEAISDTADRAAKLTSQLLAFARRQALKPEIFDAAMRIHGIADMLRTIMGSRVRLNIEDDCNDCFVEADLGQFETALVNMAVNARDAMEGEGDLTIRIARDKGAAGEDVVAISVVDTGHGIAPERTERIFEPFFTTKAVGKGTGLGLSQVYGFIKQSDGDITVESEVGLGTSFTLTLPRTDVAGVPEEVRRESQEPAPAGGRVLVVEDNSDVGEFASQLLTDLGFETRLATNAEEALEILQDGGERFDIIFSDVVMPGMGGVELAKHVRENYPSLPIVLTSGYSHVLAEESRHGFPLLHKPYSVEGLARSLREARETHARNAS